MFFFSNFNLTEENLLVVYALEHFGIKISVPNITYVIATGTL